MSTLHGEEVVPGNKVYDLIDGWGCVESVQHSCIWVRIGKRTKRRYTRDGFTGNRATATLEWHRPPRVRFSKGVCKAEEQRKFLEGAVSLMNSVSGGNCGCASTTLVDMPCPDEVCNDCGTYCGSRSDCGA